MNLTIQQTGVRVRCGAERCPRFIAIINDGRMHVKNGDQIVIAKECTVVCKCGYMNYVALRDDTTS